MTMKNLNLISFALIGLSWFSCTFGMETTEQHAPRQTEAELQAIMDRCDQIEAELNAPELQGCSPLHLAIKAGHISTALKLLQYGANPNESNHQGDTPLHDACERGLPVVTALLDAGAAIDRENSLGMTPLHVATMGNQEEIVAELLKKASSLACKGRARRARSCFDKQGWLDAQFQGSTALHYAAHLGCTGIAQKLLAAGADPLAANKNGALALHAAANRGHSELVALLLNHTPKRMIDTQNTDHQTALLLAVVNQHDQVANVLLNHKASPILPNKFGNTPLHWAVRHGNVLLVARLIEQAISLNSDVRTFVNAADRDGQTALHITAYISDDTLAEAITKSLLAHGARVAPKTRIGETALDMALVNCLSRTSRLLTEALSKEDVPDQELKNTSRPL